MEVPAAKEYLAVLVDPVGRVLLRKKPGAYGGYFIRAEPLRGEPPDVSLIKAVFAESGLVVEAVSAEPGVSFGRRGSCAHLIVRLSESSATAPRNDSVGWYGIEDAYELIFTIEDEQDYLTEYTGLEVVRNILEKDDEVGGDLKGVVDTGEFRDFSNVCFFLERALQSGQSMSLGLGLRSAKVVEVLEERGSKIKNGAVTSDYVKKITNKIGRKVRSREHESNLVELISIFAARADCSLRGGDFVSCKKANQKALFYIEMYQEYYPWESKMVRERAFKGGKGKGDKRKRREEIIAETVMEAVRRYSSRRKRLQPLQIVEAVLDEVLKELQAQGVDSKREDLDGFIMNLLRSDRSAKELIARSWET
ncbi:TPA: hypothetical protein ACG4N8_005637 [Pseudomonas aeruginosa]|uniref:hypothetical protein n=1 Tax=Pseudomonas aeruginosa TaxID=287 RepID=UPI0018C7563B|nr:hypothetical protein [Pseudomonas aeruginosa]MBG4707287.1 hypothetical protein [Pseudomonas aeruginosa]MBI8511937.1 hypothetical protein [Pseudomonas aeruginosa]HCL3287126.1 hypothetical protein [Pseudomonas aeruginosa]HEJ3144905.1 hypothetical protein [Pseudomonas aeruginosa]HEK1282101.1 hypothetical protein [Pseudomonas aeruginosa]